MNMLKNIYDIIMYTCTLQGVYTCTVSCINKA